MASFDILGARDAGIPDEEIATFLATRVPKFDIAGAREAGVDETAIVDFLLPKVNVKPEGVLSSIGSGAIAGLREVAGVVAPAYNAVFGLSGKELETLQRTDPTFDPEKSAVQYSPGTIAEKFAAGGTEDRSYLGASAISGLQTLGGATARVVADVYNSLFGLSAEEAAVLQRADPTFDPKNSALRYSPGTALENVARELTSDAEKTMKSVTSEEGQRVAGLEYATLDPTKAAYLSPTRVAGDVLQSLPSLVAMAVAVRLGISSGTVAREGVLAAGGTEAAAQTAAVKAITRSVTTVGAGSEGALGYGQQANSTEAKVRETPQETLNKAPEYQDLLKEGYSETEARNVLALRAGRMAGLVAGVVDAATNLASGPVFGRVISEGGGRLARFGKGFVTEAGQETVQGVGEQLGANVAEKRANPDKNITEGLGESAAQGFVVGGLVGGGAGALSGRGGPQEAAPPPTIAPVAPRPTAAAVEATLAKNKAVLLTGSEGLAPVVERVVNENETVEDFAAAANLAVGTGPNSVANFIAQGYAEIPGVSEYYTRLTKTNDDKTVRTVDVNSNGDVENDTTLLGNYTVNGTPISIRFNNRQKILQSIEEDGTVMDSSEKATRSYIGGAPLLDILRAEDATATVEPVTETVAPAVTEVAAPVTETVAPAETEAAIEQNRDRRNPASVLQMQQIANAPDYLRAGVGRSMANDAPIVAGGAIPAEQRGRVDYAVDSEGNRTKIQFAVVDASTVLTSNTVDGAVNPDYAGSSELRAIAGNGRVTGFREAYARGTADNYRAEFEADTLHGIDPEIIRSVPNPILVRVMSEADITSDMGDRTNTATQLGMNPEETARNDANRVDLNTLDFRENGDPTAEATRAFLRGMPDNERATLLDGQVPTADATMRLKRAIFFKAYNDPGLMSQLTTSEDGRTVISVLTQLAPVMSRLDQAGDLDIRNIVVDAAKIVIEAGNKGIPLSEAARQTDIRAPREANLVVALMAEKPGGVKNTVEVLRSVANFAYAEATKPETGMFGVTPRATRADVVAKLRGALSPAGAQLVMPGTEAVAPPPSLAVELARLEGRQTKMGRTGQEAPGGIFTAAEAAKQGELALPQNILDLAEKWFNADQNMIDNTEYTPEGEGRVAGKYKAASTMTFRRLSTALKKIEPNAAKRLEILQDLFRKNGAKVAASQAAPAVEPGLKSVGVGANGQSVAAVRAQMVPLKGITVKVVQSASELPETAAPSMAEGAWYSGTTVYLVADNLPNARRVQEVLAHEAIGHAALETMLGPQLMAELLTNVQTLERLGGRQIQAIAAYVDQRQPGLAPTDRAKEIIAVMAERGEYTNSSVWRRAIEAVRSWLRTQGFTIAFSNQDVLAMLRDAEKFANRAPETTAATGGRYSVAEGEANVTRAKPDINKKRMVKLLGPQLYGDMRDIAPVTVKELFQNSFDAVKGALERGDISLGHISITTDQAARTITIVDDGGGMAVDTINKAFLTMAGTEKDTERASGGLGIAKMLFLLGNKALRLETVRSGQVSRMTTSGSQITETLDNPDLAPLIETRSTTAAPGTTVVVTIPETYVDNDTNEVTDIPFPNAYFLSALIDASPLLANIEVKLNDSVRPIGANYNLNGATVLTEVKFPWGTARLLVRPNKNPARQNLNVLSEGLNQFGLNITKDPGDPFSRAVPYDFLLNLEPTVKADSPRYPIALNRQGFSASAKSDMGALIDYVNVLYANKTDQDSAKTFGALELLERAPGGYQIKNVSLQIPDAAVGTVLSINPTDNVKVVDGRVIVNNRPMPPLTKDNVKAMRRNPQQFRVDQSLIDKDAVIFHDNVLTDGKPLLAEARAALGAGPVNEYLNGLGGIIQDLRAATARVGGANYASVTDIPTGLSFDTTYYGVNTTIPFKAIMLNPMVVRDPETGYAMTPNTLSRAERASTFVGTIVHELVHHAEKNHSETGFIPELARVSVQLAVSGDLAIAVQNVNQLLQRYDAVAEYFMEKNANGNITARGVRLAGNAERTGPGVSERPTGASGTGRNGENAVREGVGRGDTAGTGSQERGGPAAEGGEGVAVGDERYSIKSETLPGITVAQVKSSIANAAGALRIKTNVYATVAEARAATGVDIPADALGMYSKNELHFIAENISSGLNAEITLWHEVTHAGLDRLYGFGSAQYNAALTTIALRNPEIQREAAKWRAEFGADILQRAQDRGVTAEKAALFVRMRAIDEALAVMSSQNVSIRGLDKFIAAVQKILRQVGLTKLADAMEGKTNAEALALISKARGAVMADGSYVVTDSVPAFSRGAGLQNRPLRVVESIPYNAVQTTVRLNKLEDETDPVALKNGVVALARDLRVQAANRPVRERSRGYDWIQERLLRAARLGEMAREQVRLGMWLLNNNPNLADDLGISLRTARSNDASGTYNPMSRIMTLFKGRGQDTVIAHEILHHAERMMPEDIQAGIRAEWLSQITGMLDAAIRTNDTEMVGHLRDVLRAAGGNTTAYNRVADAIRNGTLSQDFYQYINPSEFWAVNAADIVAARASESWVQRAVQWLREFKAKIQELFNFPSNAAVIRGLDNVLNAANEGERQSPNMLSEGDTFNAMGNRTEPTLPVPETKTEKRLDSAVYNYVDRFVDLKNLMKTIKTQAAALPEALDAYSMVERLTSIVAKRLEDFGLREIGPLMTEMKARGVDVPSLDRYLWMRGAEDANRIIAAQPDTKFPNFDGAGVSTTDAQAYLAALTPAQRTAFEALARRVYAITAKTRREWVNSGLATLDDVLTMEREQPYYVPFNREGKDTVAGTGQGVSVRGPNTYHRKGSDLPVVDVLANIIHQRERAVTRGQKNLIARAIYTLAKAFPDADTWSLAKPGLTSAIDAETGEPVNILDMSYQKDDNVLMSIRLDKDGKMVSQGVAFNEENPQAMRMVGALKNLDLPSLQGLLGGTALVTRYFAALNTQYNPIFGIINFLRDVPTGQLNLSTTPIAGKQGAVFLRVGPSLAAIYKGARARRGGLSPVATEYDNYFERLRNAGGTSGWRQSYETSADRGKALQKELESLSSGVANKILPAIGGWLSDYNTAMENSVRLAAFITAVESGMSDAQAASLAKNLTVNFDRKGARSSQIGALFAFFNPSVQGTVRTFETLSGPAGKKIIAGGLLLGAVQAVILAMAGFDDDDPPEFVRQRNVIIPIGDKKYVSFPMPLGFNIIPNIGRLAMQTVLRPQNIGKNVFSVLDATLSTFNPFGSGVSLQTITPTALDPLVAIATNTDWTGRPIEREDFSSLDPTPGFTRAKDTATAVNKVIAEAINTLTGGNKYTPGKWSPTPDLLDYVAGQLTGGPGRELIHLESSVEGWLTGKEVPTYKVPLVGRFYGNVGSEASDKARYYENVKKINELENNIKGMQKDRVSANEYRQDNPQARLIPAANVIKKQISQFRAQKDRPNNDDVKTDALILRQMQRLNALVAPYNAPTEQQKFLRGSVE